LIFVAKMEMTREKRRAIVVAVYIGIFLLITLLLWLFLKPSETCSDGIQNQNEKGVDCGGRCTPCKETTGEALLISEETIVFGGGGTWDASVILKNPNTKIGSPKFSYTMELLDSSGAVVAKRSGSSYILPAEQRVIIELGFDVPSQVTPTEAKMEITDISWAILDNLNKPQISTFSKNVSTQSGSAGTSAYAILRNESVYDLGKVDVAIVLRDSQNKIIALNKTEKDTMRSGEERDFKLTWPYQLEGDVAKMEVEATSDMYDPMNILNASYKKGQYQDYQ